MIEVVLNGGLGNQMFQYAAGKALSCKWNRPLVIDTTILDYGLVKEGYTVREYELGIFPNVNERRVNHIFQGAKRGYSLFNRVQYMSYKFVQERILKSHIYNEQSLLKNNSHPNSHKIILNGYFQSEDYFIDALKQVRESFRFSMNISQQNQSIIDQLESTMSISLHVRRTDYLSALHSDNHPVCSLEYYTKAIAFFKVKLEETKFFVFSDDIEWASNNIPLSTQDAVFIDHNKGMQSFEDMRLMSHASHHIIANSSFSWWGAWLNDSDEKIVIAPKKWSSSLDEGMKNVVPQNWVRF